MFFSRICKIRNQKNHIPATYGKLVPQILNRHKDGLCPMEETVAHTDNPKKAVELLKQKMETLGL